MDISPEAKKRLAALIEERDMPLAPLAAKIGVSQSTLWTFVYGDTKNFSKIHRLAAEFKVSLDWILNGDLATPHSKQAQRALAHMSEHLPGKFSEMPIPVLGRPGRAADAVILDRRERIGETDRHPAQKNDREAFALYVRGESMSPRYRPGELVYAVAGKSPAKGQDCIVELVNGEGYVREFSAHKGKFLVCNQLDPARESKWPMSEVKLMHAVVGRG